jgi:LysM repeat protein
MGGGDVVGGRGFHGHYASINLADHGEIIHINIEKAEAIQEQLVAKIVQLTRTPTAGQGEVVPIRYAVPARAPIELWDSGVPVKAQAGDTLQSLATAHHVPLWALAQINRMPERATLAGGERIIVPRNLAPAGATAALSYAPANR